MIVTEDNVGQYYPGYAFNHPLFTEGMRLVSDSKVSRFLSSVTKDQIFGFLDDWNKDKDHQAKVYISYDSTNKNSLGKVFEVLFVGIHFLRIVRVSLADDYSVI